MYKPVFFLLHTYIHMTTYGTVILGDMYIWNLEQIFEINFTSRKHAIFNRKMQYKIKKAQIFPLRGLKQRQNVPKTMI